MSDMTTTMYIGKLLGLAAGAVAFGLVNSPDVHSYGGNLETGLMILASLLIATMFCPLPRLLRVVTWAYLALGSMLIILGVVVVVFPHAVSSSRIGGAIVVGLGVLPLTGALIVLKWDLGQFGGWQRTRAE
jgi:hypothetical protein